MVIIVSNTKTDTAIENYYQRWEIEVLFQCLKNRGFKFEDTHITDRIKIKKMIVLLAIAFCWAHKTGEWRSAHEQEIKLKKHGRKAQNIFRYGLDLLQDTVSAINKMTHKMTKLIGILVQPFDANKQLGSFAEAT